MSAHAILYFNHFLTTRSKQVGFYYSSVRYFNLTIEYQATALLNGPH